MVKKEGLFVSGLTVLYALRYALKRIGPAHTIVRDDIFNNIKSFKTEDLELFYNEIKAEIISPSFKDELNRNTWNSFLSDLKYEIDLRHDVDDFYKKEQDKSKK